MRLADYLTTHDMTLEEFGGRISMSTSNLSRLARDMKWPGRETARRIFDETNGAVTPNDFLGVAEESVGIADDL